MTDEDEVVAGFLKIAMRTRRIFVATDVWDLLRAQEHKVVNGCTVLLKADGMRVVHDRKAKRGSMVAIDTGLLMRRLR